MKIFDYLKAVTNPKADLDFSNPEVLKDYDPYMMSRYISMCELFLPICSQINFYELPKEAHYNYYKTALPQRNIFFEYIKKEKDFTYEEKKILAKHFCQSLRKIDEMITLMNEKEVKEILNIYRDQDGGFSYAN
jgi:hypothetical protein